MNWECQRVEPKSIVFKGKCDIMNCGCYGAVKFIEHSMKVVEVCW